MIAADVMTRPAFAIAAKAPLAQAIRTMLDHKLSGLPVVSEEGRLIGILTEGDLLRRVETDTAGRAPGWFKCFLTPGRAAENYTLTHGRLVEEVMTPDVFTAGEETALDEIVEIMQRHHVKRVPILRDGRLIGIVSRADLVRHVGDMLAATALNADDAAVQRGVYAAIQKERWTPVGGVTVDVVGGVVHLDGCLFDLRQRQALTVLAENVPGVQRVENRIVCIDPNSGFILYDPASETV
jgi:CBS domain-containing protein